MTKQDARFDVTTIGNYTKDTIVTAAGTTHADGGGVNYSANAALALGRKVAAIMRLALEDFHVVRALEEVGITVFATATPSSTLMRLEYPNDNPDERTLTVADTAGAFTVEQVREVDSKAFVISPSIRGEVPLEVVQELRNKNALISADVQGFIRIRHPDGRLEHTEWPERHVVLPLVDILKADAVEAESITGESDIRKAARALAALGSREVIITHRDGIVLFAEGQFFEADFHAESMLGRSGRGDTCVGSYVAARLEHPPEEALRWSAAVTSLKVAVPGPIRRSREEIVDLMEQKYRGAALSV
jgi:sugar/nucleoside kinase (ribokinase family)